MVEYAFLTEGDFSDFGYNTLSRAILSNLNILESKLGLEMTSLRCHGAGNHVCSWITNQGWALVTRIDEVRASLGLAVFEWPLDFNLLNQSRFYSASDINMIARAVGMPFPQTNILSYDLDKAVIADVDSVYASLDRRDRRCVYDLNIPTMTYELDAIRDWEDNYNDAEIVTPFTGEHTYILSPDKSYYTGRGSFDSLQCFFFAILEHEFRGEPYNRTQITPSWPLTRADECMSRGLFPDPELHNQSLYQSAYKPNEFSGFLDNIYNSHHSDYQPGWTGSELMKYELVSTSMNDALYSPQLAALTNITSLKSKAWTFTANFNTNLKRYTDRYYAAPNESVEDIVEDIEAAPIQFNGYEVGEESSYFIPGAAIDLGSTFVADGVLTAIADSIPSTDFYIGVRPNPEWSERPEPADVYIDPINSYQSNTGVTAGPVFKRKVVYSCSQAKIPVVWLACTR